MRRAAASRSSSNMAHRLTPETLDSEEALRALIGEPNPVVQSKVAAHLVPLTRRFIELSPFVCLATSDATLVAPTVQDLCAPYDAEVCAELADICELQYANSCECSCPDDAPGCDVCPASCFVFEACVSPEADRG